MLHRSGNSHHMQRMHTMQCSYLHLDYTSFWLKILLHWNRFTLTKLFSKFCCQSLMGSLSVLTAIFQVNLS